MTGPRLILGHYIADSVTHPMLITKCIQVSTRRSPWATKQGWVPKPGQASTRVWTRNLPIHLQPLQLLGHTPRVRVFMMIWFLVALFWDFLTCLWYFQMKLWLLIVIDIFELTSSRHQFWSCTFVSQDKILTIMLIWCLKQFKDFIF